MAIQEKSYLLPSDTLLLSSSGLTGGSIKDDIRINNDTMLSGFSGREADASCRRMTGKENAYCRMTIGKMSFPRRRESIKHYCRLFTLVCGILITFTTALAEDTTTETCANGAGTVITGAVTGHKYCMSNKIMNWWNAVSWCDAQGRRLFERSDCACSNTTADCRGNCPELKEVPTNAGYQWVWATSSSSVYGVYGSSGSVFVPASGHNGSGVPLCY